MIHNFTLPTCPRHCDIPIGFHSWQVVLEVEIRRNSKLFEADIRHYPAQPVLDFPLSFLLCGSPMRQTQATQRTLLAIEMKRLEMGTEPSRSTVSSVNQIPTGIPTRYPMTIASAKAETISVNVHKEGAERAYSTGLEISSSAPMKKS